MTSFRARILILLFTCGLGCRPVWAAVASDASISMPLHRPTLTERIYSLLAPDAVAFDFSRDETLVMLKDREPLRGHGRATSQGLGELAQFAGRFGFTSLPDARTDRLHLGFHLIPLFTFAFQNVGFDSKSVFVSETDFQMFRTSLGYGPEVTLSSWLGTFYLDLVPGISYSWVSWSSPVSGGSMWKANTNLATSIGYFRHLSPSWVMRLFARQVVEDTQVWREAFNSSQGFEVPVERVSTTLVGVSLCYVFGS